MKLKIMITLCIAALMPIKAMNLQKIKKESNRMLDSSRIRPEIEGLAYTIIQDAGLDKVIYNKDFHTTPQVQKRVESWCKHNPSGCNDMKTLMPYALRYQALTSIEHMQKEAERNFSK